MADFEDANSPTWANVVEGQVNLRDAVRGIIEFTSPEGKAYRLNEKTATLMVRPRGWHLKEKHIVVDGQPVSGVARSTSACTSTTTPRRCWPGAPAPTSICPSWRTTSRPGSGTTCSCRPRTLWACPGTIKATVLIETILAAFEMDEILYELRDQSPA